MSYWRLQKAELEKLFGNLQASGYRVIGPALHENTIQLRELAAFDELPKGYGLEQEAATSRLIHHADDSLFRYTVGADSPKKFLHPPRQSLWHARRQQGEVSFVETQETAKPIAFFGIRSCDLASIQTLDRVFGDGDLAMQPYQKRREKMFTVVAECFEPAATCFCTSMNTGPTPRGAFDVAIAEELGTPHAYWAWSGTDAGRAALSELGGEEFADLPEAVTARRAETPGRFRRHLPEDFHPQSLKANPNHPAWNEVAERCLSCANCTLVCPTCFCSTTEDHTDLQGENSERWLKWDSCFSEAFSYIHGGTIRASTKSRYRQWLTHKFSTWHDQFGQSGCVGCGRCIGWCPVGIDVTEEITTQTGGSHEEHS